MAENPVTTIVVAVPTTTMGVVNKIFSNSAVIHEWLNDISIFCGIIACCALARVHWLRGNREAMINRKYELYNEEHELFNKEHASFDKQHELYDKQRDDKDIK